MIMLPDAQNDESSPANSVPRWQFHKNFKEFGAKPSLTKQNSVVDSYSVS